MKPENMENAQDDIHFERITARTVLPVCRLSNTLPPEQKAAVTDNAVSIAQGHFSENTWMRAIYAGETLVGFIMLHIGSDWADGIDCPGVFLWRLMIAKPYQGCGYGREAMNVLIRHLRGLGVPALCTSYHLGEGSPEGFYKALGFVPTGEYYGDEPEVALWLDPPPQKQH